MRTINKIIVHCSGTPPDADIGVDEIDDWHKKRGWSGIGYHFVIRRNGVLEHGRPVEQQGAHCYGHNHDSMGVCLIGGKHGAANFTAMQYLKLWYLLTDLKRTYKKAEIKGHRDFTNLKTCPGFDVRYFI